MKRMQHVLMAVPIEVENGRLSVGPAVFQQMVILCRDCGCFPQPDGIAHECAYWHRLTNENGWCSNGRPKKKE